MSSISTVENYRATVRELSDRIVEAQRPIRILDAIKWDASIERAFFESAFTELPPVDRAYYEARPLSFDPVAKRHELREIERDILSRLGPYNTVGVIIAAVLLTLLPEVLRVVPEVRMIVYSLLLVVMMIVAPKGLFNATWWRGISNRLRPNRNRAS